MVAVQEFAEKMLSKHAVSFHHKKDKVLCEWTCSNLTNAQIVRNTCARSAGWGFLAMTAWDIVAWLFGFGERKEDPLSFSNLASNLANSAISGKLKLNVVGI